VSDEVKSWSWYWHAEKLGPNIAWGYFDIGMHFWEKRNERGLRTRPIEAVDMFRKALEIAPDNLKIKLYSAHATIYRFLNNDPTQFPAMMDEMFAKFMDPQCENKLEYLGRLLLMSLEANRLGFWLVQQDDYETLKTKLRELPGSDEILAEIECEEKINRGLINRSF